MKLPKARQLPSGSWFVRVRVDGKDISITRSTEKEAIAEAMAIKAGLKEGAKRAPANMTLREAIDAYIELREAALSPSTIRGYVKIRDYRFQSVMDLTINKTTDAMYQRAVNLQTKTHSPKTVKNAWGLVSSVLKQIAGRKVECALPQVVEEEQDFLEPEEIPVFVKAIEGHKHEIPILLALHGLRSSEILDVAWKDIDLKKNVIHVRGSAVRDRYDNLIHKETNKNATSRRDVPILIDRLAEAVTTADKSGEYVCSVQQAGLYNAINKVCRGVGLAEVGTHGLRHSFASLCFHLSIPVQMTQKLGGWKNPTVLNKIYTHLAYMDKLSYTESLRSFFNSSNR